VTAFCLSFHAGYRCRHSGACCNSGWAIPVEPALRARLDEALTAGTLRLAATPFVAGEQLADGSSILRLASNGACSCYEANARRCRIHGQLGHDALPAACQHFPRVCLIDADGAFVTLSHYCPTAARMLVDETGDTGLKSRATPDRSPEPPPTGLKSRATADGAPTPPTGEVRIVEAPASFAAMPLEGLDARDALPPLLRPGMLADRDSYRLWETRAIAVLSRPVSAEEALARIEDVTETIRRWSPGRFTLADAVAAAFEAPDRGQELEGTVAISGDQRALDALVRECVPRPLSVEPPPRAVDARFQEWVAPAWVGFAPVVRRYLASKLFANWCAYQGEGLRTVVRSVRAALAVLSVEASRHCAAAGRVLDEGLLVEAIRSSDLLLVHLASREQFAARLGRCETTKARPVTY
jgi:Fe-S-cluster containining protein